MTMVFPFVWSFGVDRAGVFLGEQFGPRILQVMLVSAMLVPWILILYFGVQRLANVGMSRWWYLGNLVPILNLWVGYRMYACPAGYAYHKKMDAIGIVLAILYWLLVALILLSVLAMIAVFFGMAGSPEVRQQINEAIQEALRRRSAWL
jgi:nitrate/nitrite transporter NarK